MAMGVGTGQRILVTGANGFIGRHLVQRLLAEGLDGRPVERLLASDLRFDAGPRDARLQRFEGSISDAGQLERLLAQPVDTVFHLVGVPADVAEREPEAGRRVNLDATVRLLRLLARQASAPRLVFASSVAVYGAELPAMLDERSWPQPSTSEGAQKLAAEVLIADAARRGAVSACTLRLPPVLARPGATNGPGMVFMSRLLWQLRRGEPVVVPVAADAMGWWLSVSACIDHLVRAATLMPGALGPASVLQLPALHLSMQVVVDAAGCVHGAGRRGLVRFQPDPLQQRIHARLPPLRATLAESLGFRHDGSAEVMVRRATEHVMQPAPDPARAVRRSALAGGGPAWPVWPQAVALDP